MAKIFAVIKSDAGDLELLSWPSRCAFSKEGRSFLDDAYINIASTNDYLERQTFNNPHENPVAPHFGIVLNDTELKAEHMMCAAFELHFKKTKKR